MILRFDQINAPKKEHENLWENYAGVKCLILTKIYRFNFFV